MLSKEWSCLFKRGPKDSVSILIFLEKKKKFCNARLPIYVVEHMVTGIIVCSIICLLFLPACVHVCGNLAREKQVSAKKKKSKHTAEQLLLVIN